MRAFVSMFLICATLLGVVSCSDRKDDGGNAPSGRLQIAVVPKGTTHEFWKSIHAGAVKAAGELDVDVIWKGPIREDDRDAQIEVVENMISRGVSAIVLAPLDDAALRAPVAQATRAGIPVVIIDSGLKSEDHISFVATDNKKGGYRAGKRLAELLDGKGKVIMLRYQEGSASTMNREQGFVDAIKESEGIELVSANQYAGPTRETAYKASENLLAPFKTEEGLVIDGIFCPNESSTFGMLRAIEDAGLAQKVKFVGFDSSDKLASALENEILHGLVLQDPMNMGYLGVKTAVLHLRGETVEKHVDTGSTVATADNMTEEEVLSLLKPDFEKWLKD